MEILFTTQPSTISRGSTHDAQQKSHSSPEDAEAMKAARHKDVTRPPRQLTRSQCIYPNCP